MSNQLALTTLDEMERVAMALAKSGYFDDARDVNQALTKIMAGNEIGILPFASMAGIHIIKGKPVISGQLTATLIKKHPHYNYTIIQLDEKACVLAPFDKGKPLPHVSFTMADAKNAGLLKVKKNRNGGEIPNNWLLYPKNMLFNRAIGNVARWHFPDIYAGAPTYTPDEFDIPVDESGNIINVTPTTEPPASAPAVVDDQQVIVSGEPMPADGDLRHEWHSKLSDVEKGFYHPPKNMTFTKMIEIFVKRYNGDIHAAKGAATKFLFNTQPPTGKTWRDGLKRVAVYRMVSEYAKFRDAGIERAEAMQQVIEQLVLNEFNDNVLMMSPFVADLVGDYRTVYEAELSQDPIPDIEAEPA